MLLGSAGTLLGQYLSVRTSDKQASIERISARRDEWRAIIREFMAEAQLAEERCEYRCHHGEPAADANNSTLWFLQKYVQITCPPAVSKAALDYAWRLDRILWGGYDTEKYENVWADITDHRDPFLREATKLLEIPA